jgi:hypothetical protein
MVAFGALLAAAYVRHYSSTSPASRAAFDPAAYSLSGFSSPSSPSASSES